jgi:hypothetical protein
MFKKKIVISLSLMLVFIFPLMYQPYHTIAHHGDFHEHHDGISSSQEKCLVYEYHFASFDLPSEINFEPFAISHLTDLNSFYKEVKFNQNIFFKATRAPPTLA